jgi:hypothetical protein
VLRVFIVTGAVAVNAIVFEWGRCIDEYQLTADGLSIEAVSERFETYRPTEFRVLFQTFIDTPASPQGALGFVNKFGGLGGLGGGINYANEIVDGFFESQQQLKRASQLAKTADWIGLVDYYNGSQSKSGRVRSQLRHQPRGKVALVFVPVSLIQFLWLQFALHEASGTKLLRCERCSAPFDVGAGTGRRETAKFCSNACKVAAFRARNEGPSIHA